MKRISALLLILVSTAALGGERGGRTCDIHPLTPGCPAFCHVHQLDPLCGGNAGENFCTLKPFEKGCPNDCRIHPLHPSCR